MQNETPQTRYNKQHMKNVTFSFNRKTEQELLDKLDNVPNKSGYIKQLIRADIARTDRTEN